MEPRGKWSSDHLALLQGQECDVWLLTEVPTDTSVPGMVAHRTVQSMGPGKTWAGIFSIVDIIPQPDPHPATAMAHCDGLRFMSSVLPWRSCGAAWEGATLAEKMRVTLTSLRAHIDETTRASVHRPHCSPHGLECRGCPSPGSGR